MHVVAASVCCYTRVKRKAASNWRANNGVSCTSVEALGGGGRKGWRGMGMQQAAGVLLLGCMIGREAVMCVCVCECVYVSSVG